MFLIPLIFNKEAPSGDFKRTFAIANIKKSNSVEPINAEVELTNKPEAVEAIEE